MPAYDANFSIPPAPIALATLRNSAKAKSSYDVPMLIDSGSDATLVLRVALSALGLTDNDLISTGDRLIGFDGNEHTAEAVRLELHVFDRQFRANFLICDGHHGIVGRDILNLVRLVLDGPANMWEVDPK